MMAVGTYVPGTWYSSLDPWTTIGPLMLIVGLTLLKEGAEDRKRHKADHQVRCCWRKRKRRRRWWWWSRRRWRSISLG
jgi:hypothetical protein